MRLAFELVDSGGQIALPSVGGQHPIPEINERWRKRESVPSLPACMSWDISLLLPLERDSHHRSPRPQAFRCRLELQHWLSRAPTQQMVDYQPLSSHEPTPCNNSHVSLLFVLFLCRTLTHHFQEAISTNPPGLELFFFLSFFF